MNVVGQGTMMTNGTQTEAPLATATLAPAAPVVAPTTTMVTPVPTIMLTEAPNTQAPVTMAPVTMAPVTMAPITPSPVTLAPVTQAPVTSAPVESQGFFTPVAPVSQPPTMSPSKIPSSQPSSSPSYSPSSSPSSLPSLQPTETASFTPSQSPSSNQPSSMPSRLPTTLMPITASPFASPEPTKNNEKNNDKQNDDTPTQGPSAQSPTSSPVDITNEPTFMPTNTVMPTEASTFELSADVSILVESVRTRMSPETIPTFVLLTTEFLDNLLGLMEIPIMEIDVIFESQELVSANRRLQLAASNQHQPFQQRDLQQVIPLRVDLIVNGEVAIMPGRVDSADDVDFAGILRNLFEVQGDAFVTLLQTTAGRVEDEVYFETVQSISPFNPPTTEPPSSANTFGQPSPSDDGGGLPLGAIIGIAAGGTVVLILILVILICRQRRANKERRKESGDDQQSSDAKTTAAAAGGVGNGNLDTSRGRARLDSNASDSVLQSDVQSHLGTDTIGGADTMSYAYSLDHGIDASVASATGLDFGAHSHSSSGIEVPHYVPGTHLNRPRSSSSTQKMKRECFAPPGKLGIVIDTTSQGPRVHKVNPGSPLEGIVWPGDIVIAINDVDTRKMAANDITQLMAKNMHERRKLTILSDA